ncbi:hypothetical protein HG536_0C00490 [Torulaspora globosa]|uniref:SET domain-containing protein n=1 Tax=Torulaspora globosa TaxID=48254 RepID=A0A7G3ZEE6_9SACH|nr:uncharacterized protein HG536_0C00490 [Torulaspora globosa]QLL31882.1 hypothetical protein HG536_0C00490 [Torulaspora globosa]
MSQLLRMALANRSMLLDNRLEKLVAWLGCSDQFYLSDDVEVNECEESGRGVVLKGGALKKNETVVRVPNRYQLNFNSILWNMSLFNRRICVSGITVSERERQIQREQLDDNDPRFRLYSVLDQETVLSFSSFQLLAFYILVERVLLPLWFNGSIQSFWQPFFDVWPSKEELGSIPAIWNNSASSRDKKLLGLLPLASQKLIKKKNALLRQDWDTIRPWLVSSCEQLWQEGHQCPSIEEIYEDFLHVYFIINSRCLYSEVQLKKDDVESQFTMVPFVDFLNHTDEVDQHCYPEITRDRKDRLMGVFSLKCGKRGYVKAGENILLNYGPHSNDFLLNEYGFVLQENRWNFIDISDEVTNLIGGDAVMMEFLKEHAYWDNYTINYSEISYRALVALSLLVTQDYRRVEKLLLGYISEDYFLPKISDKLRELLERLLESYRDRLESLTTQPGMPANFSARNLGTIYRGYIDIIEHHLGSLS